MPAAAHRGRNTDEKWMVPAMGFLNRILPTRKAPLQGSQLPLLDLDLAGVPMKVCTPPGHDHGGRNNSFETKLEARK